MKSIKYLFIGVIATLTLFAGSSWVIAGPKVKLGVKVTKQCVNLQDGVHSMSLIRNVDHCSTDLTTVKFFEKADCKGKPTFGKVGSDAGKVVCSDVSGGCDECLFQEQNSPIVFTYWNGSGWTTACFEDPLTPANDECCTIHQINC